MYTTKVGGLGICAIYVVTEKSGWEVVKLMGENERWKITGIRLWYLELDASTLHWACALKRDEQWDKYISWPKYRGLSDQFHGLFLLDFACNITRRVVGGTCPTWFVLFMRSFPSVCSSSQQLRVTCLSFMISIDNWWIRPSSGSRDGPLPVIHWWRG